MSFLLLKVMRHSNSRCHICSSLTSHRRKAKMETRQPSSLSPKAKTETRQPSSLRKMKRRGLSLSRPILGTTQTWATWLTLLRP